MITGHPIPSAVKQCNNFCIMISMPNGERKGIEIDPLIRENSNDQRTDL